MSKVPNAAFRKQARGNSKTANATNNAGYPRAPDGAEEMAEVKPSRNSEGCGAASKPRDVFWYGLHAAPRATDPNMIG